MSTKHTFVRAVEQCPELPEDVREAAKRSTVEEHSFGQTYINFLDEQIRLSPRGPAWSKKLKERRDGLLRFTDQALLRSSVQTDNDLYRVEVDPKSGAVVCWERFEKVRDST